MASIKKIQKQWEQLDIPAEPCINILKRLLKAKGKDLRCTPLVTEFITIINTAFDDVTQRDKSIEIIEYATKAFEKKIVEDKKLHPNYLKAIIKSQLSQIEGNGNVNQWGKTI